MAKKSEHLFFNGLPDFEKEAEEEKRLAKTPKAPSFSLEDMEGARQSSYDKGHADGLQNAKDSIEQQTEILVQSLTSRIHDLEQSEGERHDHAINNAIAIAEKSIQHLLPALLDHDKETMIMNALKNFFSDNTPRSTLTLFVNPDMLKPLEKHVLNLSSTLTMQADDALTAAQARLEWVDGTFEFQPDEMVNQILDIMKQYSPQKDDSLDGLAQNTHNNDETDEKQDS